MSKELLIELQRECIELAVAGSDLAIGNFKLQKLLPKFEKIGQKIKPFKMVENRLDALLNSEKEKSEDHLISLYSLLNAIILTQAKTDIEGEIEIQKGTSFDMNTNLPNHMISPVVNALTTSGGGRLNIIEEGIKEGILADFRLIPLLIKGLDDSFIDIGQLIHKELLSMNNPNLLHLLEESFDRQGKRGHAFRLNLMAQMLGDDAKDLAIELLEDSSKEIKIEAVNILGNMKDTEDILLEQVKSKIKDIRKAAYFGLVKMNSEEGAKELEKAIKKTDYDIVLEAINVSESENYEDVLLTGLKDIYGKLIKKESQKGMEKIIDILDEIKDHKREDVFEFLVKCLEEGKMDDWKTQDYYHRKVDRRVVECIVEYDHIPEEVRDLIEGRKEMNNYMIFDLAFEISLKSRTSEEVYEIYSPYFIKKRINKDTVESTIDIFLKYLGYKMLNGRWYGNTLEGDIEAMLQPVEKEFDKRWRKIFRDYESYEILAYTIDKEDEYSIELLLNKCKSYKKHTNRYTPDFSNCIFAIMGLLKIGYEEIYEIILNEIKVNTDYSVVAYNTVLFIPYLSSSYIKEIEEYLVELKKKNEESENFYLDMLVERIEEMLVRVESKETI